ncbi:MAG: hypothetical protein IPK44_15745 [Candidatus Accumulibacter sp.]|uniref:hypothetical protein n=1 Tax=Accumulibacter sp. TaxID=2053492 RepID=UPI00258EDA67|nr:hypothetical protein [Accumulibacter sp.]MBK8115833.1 hypothetical protein [Accumulibacter sp.]
MVSSSMAVWRAPPNRLLVESLGQLFNGSTSRCQSRLLVESLGQFFNGSLSWCQSCPLVESLGQLFNGSPDVLLSIRFVSREPPSVVQWLSDAPLPSGSVRPARRKSLNFGLMVFQQCRLGLELCRQCWIFRLLLCGKARLLVLRGAADSEFRFPARSGLVLPEPDATGAAGVLLRAPPGSPVRSLRLAAAVSFVAEIFFETLELAQQPGLLVLEAVVPALDSKQLTVLRPQRQ